MTTQKATTSDFISAVSTALANGDDVKVSFDLAPVKNWWTSLSPDRKNQLIGGLGGLALGSLGGGLLGGGRGAAIGALAGGGLGALGGNYFNPAMGWLKEQLPEKEAFSNPYASPQDEEDEEEEKRKKFPLLPLAGAGALGYGAYKLPNVFGGSQQQVDTFERATKGYNPQAFAGSFNTATNEYINKGLPKNTTELQYYGDILAPAAQMDIGGKPVGDALVAIRGNKKLMKFLEDQKVISPGYGLNDRASMFGNSGAGHYRQFRQGSIPAYMHMMTAHHKGKQVPYSMLSDDELKNALAYSAGPESSTDSITPDLLKKDSPLSYPEWIERRLQKHLASKVPSSGTPWELDTRFLPEEEQQELMKSWFASMTPEEQKYRLQIEDLPEKYITQTSNYLPKAQQVTGIRKKLQQAAPYVAGGAGLYALYKLVNYLRDRVGDDEEEEQQEEAEQSLAKAAAEKQAVRGVAGLSSLFKAPVNAATRGVKNVKSNVVNEIGANPDLPLAPQVVQYMGTNRKSPLTGKPQLPLSTPGRGEYLGNMARAAVLPRIPKSLGGRATGSAITAGLVGTQAGPAINAAVDVYKNPQNYIGGEGVFDASTAPSSSGGWVRDIGENFATGYGADLTKAKLSGLLGSGDTPYYPYQSRVDAAIGNTAFDYLNNIARRQASGAAKKAPLVTAATPFKGLAPSTMIGQSIRALGHQVPVEEALTLGQAMKDNIPAAYEGVENPMEILEDLRRSALLKRMNEARKAVPAGMSLEKDRLLDFLSSRRDALEGSSRDAYQQFINEYTGK